MSGPLGTSGGGATGVTSVTAGNGITVTGTTTPTIAASIAAGTGVSIAGTTTLTVSATGVNSVSAGTGISVSGTTALTVSATGVQSLTAGNGITVSGTTTPTVSASLAAGTGIGISGTTTLSVSNTGVTSIVAGTNVSVSGATGAVTVNAPAYGTTITASTIGGTAAAGTSTGVAREDHKHAFPSGAAPSALTVSSTQATGTSASPALADHVHAMPGSATAGASAVGDTAATGTAATVALSDHRHSREAFGTPLVVNGQTTSLATGSLTTLARADHVHTMSNVPVLLASTTLASAAASVTFSSISGTYKHLAIMYNTQTAFTGGQYDLIGLRFNSDAAANYYSSQDATLNTEMRVATCSTTVTFPTNEFSGGQYIIFNYANTTIRKSAGALFMNTYGTSPTRQAYAAFYGGIWQNTAAITSVTVVGVQGNLVASSTFQLYGWP